jgi:hypothetical protein
MEPPLQRRFRSAAPYYLSGRPPYSSLLSIIERRFTAVERFPDRALSLSITSRERLGAKADDLSSEVRALLAKFALEGVVTEVVESTALIARRKAPVAHFSFGTQ